MTGANVIAALLFFAAFSLGLGLLDFALDKLRIPARWRLWYYKTFGGRRHGRRR